MGFDADLEMRIKDLIEEQLGKNLNAMISIDSIDIMEDDAEIRIVVSIETSASSDELARRYFGLTGRVREVLGDRWKNYFPVITPNIGHSAHA